MTMPSLLMILLILYFSLHATTHAHDDLPHQIPSKEYHDEMVPLKSWIHFEVKPDLSAKGLVKRQGRGDDHEYHKISSTRHVASPDQKQSSSTYGAHEEYSKGMSSRKVRSPNHAVSGSWRVDDHRKGDWEHPAGFHPDYLPPRTHPPHHN
ncbi:hypothetical protein Sjap_004305 [Stephania japonica]|uniref:Uncharacterized protein n=1 Tax=Stephania japonica TaxID=461633 RepID=A0AAP0K222_9MAGN